MAYSYEIISELEAFALNSGGQTVDKYISTKNATALLVGVKLQESGGTIPTIANINTKIGTINVIASNKDGGGPQVSWNVADIAPLQEKLYGKPLPQIYGTQADTDFLMYGYYIPLSPQPLVPTFGFRDARIQIVTTGTQTASQNYVLYVMALLHDQKPNYYIQTLMQSETGVASNGKVDEDIPEGGLLMADYAFTTTSFQSLTTSDAPTLTDIAVVVDNSEQTRISQRAWQVMHPCGVYNVVTTPTYTGVVAGSAYHFDDFGWMKSAMDGMPHGISIGRNWKLRLKTNAADAIRNYKMVALKTGSL